jgi:hypothetical protein
VNVARTIVENNNFSSCSPPSTFVRSLTITDSTDSLPLANSPEVFGLHPNAEINYYSQATREIWNHLIELQPQTGEFYFRKILSPSFYFANLLEQYSSPIINGKAFCKWARGATAEKKCFN